jgi:DNA modification methylase
MDLRKGDCLEILKTIDDKSIDFVYLDLPYGQTGCSWDKKIDLTLLWKELKRIAKNDRTPFFFSCTTKFGYELIKSNEKYFRWDLVWEKNRAAGFLNAYKLPMRKHEMIYCFAKNAPEYDVSSHLTGEEIEVKRSYDVYLDTAMGFENLNHTTFKRQVINTPLPTSVLPPQEDHELVYCFAKKCPEYDVSSHKEFTTQENKNNNNDLHKGKHKKELTAKLYKDRLPSSVLPTQDHELVYCFAKKCPEYDVSSHSEYVEGNEGKRGREHKHDTWGKKGQKKVDSKTHTDRLPTSVLPTQDHELVYCFAKKSPEYDVSSHSEYTEASEWMQNTEIYDFDNRVNNKKIRPKTHKERLPTSVLPTQDHELIYCFAKKCPEYDVSSHKEYTEKTGGNKEHKVNTYNQIGKKVIDAKVHTDRLPTSVLPPQEDHELVYCFAKKCPEYNVSSHLTGEEIEKPPSNNHKFLMEALGESKGRYLPHKSKVLSDPLPTSVLDIPSSWCYHKLDEKINHRTSKPVSLMEFLLKYWTKEGWTVLDPTMGSGSMGVACKRMNRKFIGIEKDDDIFELAKKRIEDEKK